MGEGKGKGKGKGKGGAGIGERFLGSAAKNWLQSLPAKSALVVLHAARPWYSGNMERGGTPDDRRWKAYC
jgi:hypothetical protein